MELQTNTRVRFVPNSGFEGTADIQFRAWDGTDGGFNGAIGVDTSNNGGITPFSSESETARITVNSPINVITGTDGNDRLFGTNSNDIIYGLAGDDIIFGGAGDDIIFGGAGNDRLFGDAGNDHLYGGSGNNTLYGGQGNDSFYFGDNQVFVSPNLGVDTISDFVVGNDKIVLSKATFAVLDSILDDFMVVERDSAAANSSAAIVYNSGNGRLFYNQNRAGSGFGSGAHFATLSRGLNLTAHDFIVQDTIDLGQTVSNYIPDLG
ncbi:calcium-binding protein [Nodularia sp. NIES-3585]|uniref:calcium-binding protein n=1 Tax=Nodularia sp. NIES-3585 TaxID=1973477 RepID=UPI00352E491E